MIKLLWYFCVTLIKTNLNSNKMTTQEKSLHYTPVELAKKLITRVQLEDGDTLLEPFKGNGAFYDNFPAGHNKDWYEIDDGKDFFTCADMFDVIITNPPFRIETDNGRKNAFVPCLEKAFSVSRKKVCMLFNHKCFNSMTPKRLHKWRGMGWSVTDVHICNVKKWFGRYYFVVFEKGAPNGIISYDETSY